MAVKRIQQLPSDTAPLSTDVVPIDSASGGTTRKTPLANLGAIVSPVASEAEAVAGVDNTKRMTPLRTKQAIDGTPLPRTYASRAAASAATIPTSVTSIRVLGWAAAGDGGPWGEAEYIEVPDTGALEAWQFRSNADTRRWQLRSVVKYPQMFGVVGTANDTAAFQALVDAVQELGGRAVSPSGTYTLTSPLLVTDSNVNFEIMGGCDLRTEGNDNMRAFVAQGAEVGLVRALTGNAGKFTSNTQTATVSPGNENIVQAGDWCLIYDTTEVTPGAGRNQEFFRVKSVASGQIVSTTIFRRTYSTANGASVVKLQPIENFRLHGAGRITVKEDYYLGTITTTNGDTAATVNSFANLANGMQVHAAGVPSAATITLGVFPNVTLSIAATADGTNTSATFFKARGGNVYLNYCVNSSVRGLELRNPMGWAAITVFRSQDILIEGNDIADGQVVERAGYGYGLDVSNSNINVVAIGNYFENLRESAFGPASIDCQFIGNSCKSMLFSAINTHAADNQNIIIADNMIAGTRLGPAIAVAYTTGYTSDRVVSITGNVISDSQQSAIQITGGTSSVSPFPKYTSKAVTVVGNIINGFGYDTTGLPPAGIFGYRIEGVTITGNVIQQGNRHANSAGIRIDGGASDTSSGISITSNVFEGIGATSSGASGTGVYVEYVSRCVIQGNNFRNIAKGSGGAANNVVAGSNNAVSIKDNESDIANDTAIASTNYVWGNSWQPRNGEPVTFTPTIASTSGTITSITSTAGCYVITGKWLSGFVQATITNNGTGVGLLALTLPVAINTATPVFGVASAHGVAMSGSSLAATMFGRSSGGTSIFFGKASDGSYPVATGNDIRLFFAYPVA